MNRKTKRSKKVSRTEKLSVRLEPDHYDLVKQAAINEGLQIASYIVMLLVRQEVLPEVCMQIVKRRPVPFFNELHELMGAINKISGNCGQLMAAMPDVAGVRGTLVCTQRAADTVIDAFQGKWIPASVVLVQFKNDLIKIGKAFNHIVHSVNMGKPAIADLPHVLAAIRESTDTLTAVMNGKPVTSGDMAYVKGVAEAAMDDMCVNMRQAAANAAMHNKSDD